jgi:MFS family permease
MRKNIAVIPIICFGAVFNSFAIRYSYGILLPEMFPALGISKTQAGIIYSSFFLTYMVFSPIAGFLSDEIDMRTLLTCLLLILGIGTFLMAYSSSYYAACFFFASVGIGASGSWAPVLALAQRNASVRRRGMVLAFVAAGAPISLLATSLAMPWVVSVSSWRTGWKGLGVLTLLLACATFFLVRNSNSQKLTLYFRFPLRINYVRILKDFNFRLIALSYLFMAFSSLIPVTFITTYSFQELGFTFDAAAKLITIMAVASIVAKLFAGTLSDILGRIKTIIVCLVLMALGSFGIAFHKDVNALNISVAIFGFAQGGAYPLYPVCASDYFPKEFVGSIIGIWTLFFGIGSILSSVIGGWTADVSGTFKWSFLLATIAALVSLGLLLPIRGSFSDQKIEI